MGFDGGSAKVGWFLSPAARTLKASPLLNCQAADKGSTAQSGRPSGFSAAKRFRRSVRMRHLAARHRLVMDRVMAALHENLRAAQ